MEDIRRTLRRIDGRGYRAYKDLEGLTYQSGDILISIAKVQGDPFATPSIIVARAPLPEPLRSGDMRWLHALSDISARVLHKTARRYTRKCGTASSCEISTPAPGPWILPRSQAFAEKNDLLLRVYAGLPADGRRVKGREAENLLLNNLPRVFEETLEWLQENIGAVMRHIRISMDQDELRKWLSENGYLAFIRDGAILPRESSLTQKPLRGAVRFESPPELRVAVDLPYAGTVRGMAIGAGVNVITGGGFHGKTTLLEAIQDGIYNHVEGDGREYVVSIRETFSVRSEDGRIVSSVDISPMIRGLPWGRDTTSFSTLDASGSTSMAAGISEAIEVGARLLLIDEDTSATNLLYKDSYMSTLIPDDPLVPLTQTARSLAHRVGVSLVVVAGASSAFIGISDRVVLMREYRASVPRIDEDIPAPPQEDFKRPAPRIIEELPFFEKAKIVAWKAVFKTKGRVQEVDLRLNPRIVETGQARLALGMLRTLVSRRYRGSVEDLVGTLDMLWSGRGFDGFYRIVPPDLTFVYPEDVVWIMNRMLGLRARVARRA